MTASFDFDATRPLQEQLRQHRVYGTVRTLTDLQRFMAHHVFSVWDFMSLIKSLQREIAPVRVPWTPEGSGSLRYFINQLVLEEESDAGPASDQGPAYLSHFELYCQAMAEVGADAGLAIEFIDRVRSRGVDAALAWERVPEPARRFTATTFGFIDSGKPHVIAAALALGREHVIPDMFRSFLKRMGITERDAPIFHYYLNRHIHLDEDFHGPLSIRMVETLCAGEERRQAEATEAARRALHARIQFWDGVAAALESAGD